MGAGKSTVGKRLAELRQLRFIDSDHEIEARTGVDIPYIFEKEGEEGFRRREEQVIDLLTQEPDVVIASGGGAVMRAANREHLAARGTVVYLHASVDQQFQRVERSDNRPLLAVADKRATLDALFTVRDPLYREIAHLVVDTDGRNARQLALDIHRALNELTP